MRWNLAELTEGEHRGTMGLRAKDLGAKFH
jgi:hypothetical protein